MPYLVIDRIEYGPPEFAELLPLRCEVVRLVTGPDGADYCLVRPEVVPLYYPQIPTPITPELEEQYTRKVYPRLEAFDLAIVNRQLLQYLPDGRIGVRIPGFIVTARYQGNNLDPRNKLGPGMLDLWVNLAYLLDPAALTDPEVDFGRLHFAAITRMNMASEATVAEPAASAAAVATVEPVIPYGKPAAEFPNLMVPTPQEQARIDQMLTEAIRVRDAVPPDQRSVNANPKYNKKFGPAAPENELTQDDIDRFRAAIGEPRR